MYLFRNRIGKILVTLMNIRLSYSMPKSKKKEQFWWDYLKLNIFLSDLEYYFGYYILMNRWQIPMIQRWIAEYREKGFFESQRAKDYILFYLKAGEKTPVRVLNSQGVQVKMKMPSR